MRKEKLSIWFTISFSTEKMDSSLGHLANCEKLSLSTNMITNIQNLQAMSKLKILSLGRNLIKSLAGKDVTFLVNRESIVIIQE